MFQRLNKLADNIIRSYSRQFSVNNMISQSVGCKNYLSGIHRQFMGFYDTKIKKIVSHWQKYMIVMADDLIRKYICSRLAIIIWNFQSENAYWPVVSLIEMQKNRWMNEFASSIYHFFKLSKNCIFFFYELNIANFRQ